MTEIASPLFQGIILILVAPALTGWLNWVKAYFQKRPRRLAFILQPYRDIYKLVHVPAVRPQTTSWLFALAPWVIFVAYGLLVFALPVFGEPLLKVDVIVVIYFLGLARFTLALTGWDAGAPFGGLGSSREMFFHFLTEIGLFFVFAILAAHWQTGDLTKIASEHAAMIPKMIDDLSPQPGLTVDAIQDLGLIFLAIAFAGILLFETGRIPVDNPATHLELTMANKAILLEFAGRDMALLEWAEMIKFAFLVALFGVLFLPCNVGIGIIDTLLLFVRVMILTVGLAFWEVIQPKKRLGQVPRLAWSAMLFGAIAFILIMMT